MVQLEELFSIFPNEGFCNKIYNNSHEIIGWDHNKGKKNIERGMTMMADASDIGNGGGGMLEGEVNRVQVTYLTIPSRL